ncbi:hypothetical protein NFC73_07220 [Pseudarthrobacter sp. RMG13]|uniref:Uncharacterized protein n=1 Tax=Pseudarthrobacter humi TaxID=2952523 RepID=A0ABT1LNX4_9MICC|nr:hypothetical protein [Pseudarthrobacter humi]MCP8999521.1 hypothetical protein [Pseudarthrobacter humi]
MNQAHLSQVIHDPRGPEEILPSLAAEDLANLLDALYQNLDTPTPVFGAQAWYELAVEESARRTRSPEEEQTA